VHALVVEGPRRVRDLVDLGTNFDRTAVGELALTREGGHHRTASCTPAATPPAPRSPAR
jgi:aspartate oxidase